MSNGPFKDKSEFDDKGQTFFYFLRQFLNFIGHFDKNIAFLTKTGLNLENFDQNIIKLSI